MHHAEGHSASEEIDNVLNEYRSIQAVMQTSLEIRRRPARL